MLPDNFDFAQLPDDREDFTLKEVGMLASRIEDIDYAITSWLKEDLDLSTITNEGNKESLFYGKHQKEHSKLRTITI